jgi:hypothetical protein
MYKSSLRHIHDPVLSSLKMKGIRLLFSVFSLSQIPLRVRIYSTWRGDLMTKMSMVLTLIGTQA